MGSGLGKIEENLQGVLSALTASNRADKIDTRKIISMGIESANHSPITENYNPGIIQSYSLYLRS